MSYTTINLTSSDRNDNPQNGDLLRHTHDNGMVIEKHFVENTEEVNTEDNARIWRNSEIASTDYIVPLTDFPNYDSWITYRQQLRDWPSTGDFPNTKPTKP